VNGRERVREVDEEEDDERRYGRQHKPEPRGKPPRNPL
jgi:hypothetical protein